MPKNTGEIGRMKKPCIVLTAVALFLCSPCLALGAADSAHEDAHGETGGKGWTATDTYRAMNFVVLAVVLVVLLRKPLKQALNARIKGIQDQLSDLEEKKKEAEQQLAGYNERLSLLDEEAERIVAEYVKQGNEAKARILQEARAAAEKIEEQAKKNIAYEFEKARETLQVEILESALAKAETVIRGSITSADQDRLVDEYLEKVEIL
jgi:F-type H+-transporting ATPase subunit b